MKKLLITVCMAVTSMAVLAQSGTNSPYSQYGLGVLGEQSGGFNRGMNGLGIGFHEHNQINTSNPASYASIDSLSFIFDAECQQCQFRVCDGRFPSCKASWRQLWCASVLEYRL